MSAADTMQAKALLDTLREGGYDVTAVQVGSVRIEVRGWHQRRDEEEAGAPAVAPEDPMAGLIPKSVRDSIDRERQRFERFEDGDA